MLGEHNIKRGAYFEWWEVSNDGNVLVEKVHVYEFCQKDLQESRCVGAPRREAELIRYYATDVFAHCILGNLHDTAGNVFINHG